MYNNSSYLETYTATLRRVYWAEFVDNQLTRQRAQQASRAPAPRQPSSVPTGPAAVVPPERFSTW